MLHLRHQACTDPDAHRDEVFCVPTFMLKRNSEAHKGDYGRVMVIGGSETFYGAPLLSSLGAEAIGVDLIYPVLPPQHLEAAKGYSLNFLLSAFKTPHLSTADVKSILRSSEKMQAVVLGPGLGTHPETQRAVKLLLGELQVPTVVDAEALMYSNRLPKVCVMTPHRGEFKELTGKDPTPENVQQAAKDLSVVMLCKAPLDRVAYQEKLAMNTTGNPLMTVGGTGDVLSGVVAGLLAQGMEAFEAALQGVRLVGLAGDRIAERQGSLRAMDLVYELPRLIQEELRA